MIVVGSTQERERMIGMRRGSISALLIAVLLAGVVTPAVGAKLGGVTRFGSASSCRRPGSSWTGDSTD